MWYINPATSQRTGLVEPMEGCWIPCLEARLGSPSLRLRISKQQDLLDWKLRPPCGVRQYSRQEFPGRSTPESQDGAESSRHSQSAELVWTANSLFLDCIVWCFGKSFERYLWGRWRFYHGYAVFPCVLTQCLSEPFIF